MTMGFPLENLLIIFRVKNLVFIRFGGQKHLVNKGIGLDIINSVFIFLNRTLSGGGGDFRGSGGNEKLNIKRQVFLIILNT